MIFHQNKLHGSLSSCKIIRDTKYIHRKHNNKAVTNTSSTLHKKHTNHQKGDWHQNKLNGSLSWRKIKRDTTSKEQATQNTTIGDTKQDSHRHIKHHLRDTTIRQSPTRQALHKRHTNHQKGDWHQNKLNGSLSWCKIKRDTTSKG